MKDCRVQNLHFRIAYRLATLPCINCTHGIDEHGPFTDCQVKDCPCPGFRSEYD